MIFDHAGEDKAASPRRGRWSLNGIVSFIAPAPPILAELIQFLAGERARQHIDHSRLGLNNRLVRSATDMGGNEHVVASSCATQQRARLRVSPFLAIKHIGSDSGKMTGS